MTDDLVKRLRTEGADATRRHLSMGMHKLCSEAADALEAKQREINELELQIIGKNVLLDEQLSAIIDLENQNKRLLDELKKLRGE